MHYLLTLPALPIPQENSNHTLNDVWDYTSRSNELAQNISKRKVEEDKREKMRKYSASDNSPEERAKANAYMKSYRAKYLISRNTADTSSKNTRSDCW